MKKYKCSPGIGPRTITSLCAIAFFIIIMSFRDSHFVTSSVILSIFPILFVLYNYLSGPLYVTVTTDAIVIHRWFLPITMPFSDIVSVSDGNGLSLTYDMRGYHLQDKSKSLLNRRIFTGMTFYYCSQARNLAIVKLKEETIVFTPNDSAGIINDIKLMHPSLIN